jgi:hypothetical protein
MPNEDHAKLQVMSWWWAMNEWMTLRASSVDTLNLM